MGAIEEGGKAANSFMEAMKSEPLSLALVIMNVCLLVTLWSIYNSAEEYRNKQMEMIFASQKNMQELLAKCVVPEDR